MGGAYGRSQVVNRFAFWAENEHLSFCSADLERRIYGGLAGLRFVWMGIPRRSFFAFFLCILMNCWSYEIDDDDALMYLFS